MYDSFCYQLYWYSYFWLYYFFSNNLFSFNNWLDFMRNWNSFIFVLSLILIFKKFSFFFFFFYFKRNPFFALGIAWPKRASVSRENNCVIQGITWCCCICKIYSWYTRCLSFFLINLDYKNIYILLTLIITLIDKNCFYCRKEQSGYCIISHAVGHPPFVSKAVANDTRGAETRN